MRVSKKFKEIVMTLSEPFQVRFLWSKKQIWSTQSPINVTASYDIAILAISQSFKIGICW